MMEEKKRYVDPSTIRKDIIIKSIINIAPNKKFYQLHRNKGNKENVFPYIIKNCNFIRCICIIIYNK